MLKRKKDRERPAVTGYDYSDREHREQTIQALFGKAQSARRATERDWERYNDYYNFIHDITGETQEAYADAEMPFAPSVMPDAFIHVESQICATVPEPEFRGRDDGMDPQKAKEREYAARFVCDNNRLKDKNTANERRLIKLGDAFWKVFWDPTMVTGVNEGDIRVDDVPVESIYPDPAARERGLQAGQYVFHLYRMHKVAFVQQYGKAIEEVGMEPEHILSNDYAQDLDLFDLSTSINEDDEREFLPDDYITRAEISAVLGRSARYEGGCPGTREQMTGRPRRPQQSAGASFIRILPDREKGGHLCRRRLYCI